MIYIQPNSAFNELLAMSHYAIYMTELREFGIVNLYHN